LCHTATTKTVYIEIKNLGKSSGLGLALSKKIALLLGGDLEVKSEGKDKGVTVIFQKFIKNS
jgi:signal transduction histidine kinase